MNKIVLFLLLAAFSLAGCHEVTVGYMKTEHAKYPIDTLYIFDTLEIRNQIDYLVSITQTPADLLRAEQKKLEKEADSLYEIATLRWINEVTLPGRELDELMGEDGKDSIYHVEEIRVLKEKIDKSKENIDLIYAQSDAKKDRVSEIEDQLAQLDPSENKPNESALAELEELRLRASKRITWTTSEIEGVDGTAPIFYFVTGIRAEGGGDAEVFRSDLKIKGNGRMEVPYDFKAPAGSYHVSVMIQNEGYSHTLDDAFTFIVNRK